MKTKHLFLLLTICSLFLFCTKGQTQVLIGINADPEEAALLEVATQKSSMPGSVTSTRGGVLLPRVELEKKTELLPFVDPSVLGTGNYENITKPQHAGLIVFNIAVVESEDLAPGLNVWTGSEWMLMGQSSGLGMAKYTVSDCDTFIPAGTYKKGVPLNTTNFLTINVSVTTPGAYEIVAKPESGNGYYFSAQGTFLTKGVHSVMLMGSGTPLEPKTSPGDVIKASFNGADSGCSLNITVDDNTIPSNFTIECASVTPNGVLPPNFVAVNQSISLKIKALPNSLGGEYRIWTDNVGGVEFTTAGTITSLTMDITLKASGTTDATQGTKTFTLYSNSPLTSPVCTVDFQSTYPDMKVAGVGGYWNPGRLASGYTRFFNSINNFGPSGTLPTKSIAIVGPGDQGLGAAINRSPDILIINFPITIGPIAASTLAAYINQGGVVLFFSEDGASTRAMFAALGESVSTSTGGGAGTMHNLLNTSDPVLDGPFKDVKGMKVVEDRSTTVTISGYSANIIPLASAGGGINPGGTMIARHATKGFIWFGDAGFDARLDGLNPGAAYPWNMDANGVPLPTNTAGGQAQNTFVVANAVAWAIKYVTEYGINHK